MTARAIQAAVARADLIICAALRWAAVLAALALILAAGVIVCRRAFARRAPPMIDYDAPGLDITAEGPEGDYTDAYREA